MPYSQQDIVNYQAPKKAQQLDQHANQPLSPQPLVSEINSYYNGRNWQISYQDYRQVHQLTLPFKLTIKQGGLTVKINLNSWQF